MHFHVYVIFVRRLGSAKPPSLIEYCMKDAISYAKQPTPLHLANLTALGGKKTNALLLQVLRHSFYRELPLRWKPGSRRDQKEHYAPAIVSEILRH